MGGRCGDRSRDIADDNDWAARPRRSRSEPEDADGSGDVLQGQEPYIFHVVGEPMPHLLMHRLRNRNATRRGVFLQPGSDIDGMPIDMAVHRLDHVP